jgi:hypothetical protein
VFGDAFLTRPESFPVRAEGEPWGGDDVSIDFLGGPYRFAGLSRRQAEWLREQSASHQTGEPSREPAAVTTRIFRAPNEDFKTIELRGWEYWLDVDYRSESVRVAGLDFMGLLTWRPELEGDLWTSGHNSARFVEAVENLFRILVAYRILEAGGILLHSAALADSEGAHVFPGRSGSGKSTLSHLALTEGWKVLSDDLNVVVPKDETFVVEQVPFAGELGRAVRSGRSFPLKAIYRVRKSDEDGLRRIRPAEALGTMLAASPNVNRDPYRSERAETLLTKIAGAYPAYELSFSLDGGLRALRTGTERPPRSSLGS